MTEVTEGKATCEAVWVPTRVGAWCCMLDEGHASESCILVPRSDREDRRRDVLRAREMEALRADVAALRARCA